MKFSSAFVALAAASLTSARMLACRVNGKQVLLVEEHSGECAFPITGMPVQFQYRGVDDYDIDSYYIVGADGIKYWNIHNVNDGYNNVIHIPVDQVPWYQSPVWHVHLAEHSNGTHAMRKRSASLFEKRHVVDAYQLFDLTMNTVGSQIGSFVVQIGEPDPNPTSTQNVTVTSVLTSLTTLTTCDSSMCHTTTVPATPTTVTTTLNGTTTTYTTFTTMGFRNYTETVAVTVCELETCSVTTTTCVIPCSSITVTVCDSSSCVPVVVPTSNSSAARSATSTASASATSRASRSGRSAPTGTSSASRSGRSAPTQTSYTGAGAVAKGSVLAMLALPLAYVL